jgi:pyruvyltransferase
MTAYWYREAVNFGDLITPLVLRHYGYWPVYESPSLAQLVAAGSVLEHLRNDFSGIILGSGFISASSRMTFPNANILAVRGKMTRERLGPGRGLVALGDPGILASQLMSKRQAKACVLGIISHYADKGNTILDHLARKLKPEVTLIDVQRQPAQVFTAIDRCQHILSSSLHGLIVSDSLGIPNAWYYSNRLWGGRFKFDDYYSSLDLASERPIILSGNETLEELVALTSAKPCEKIEKLKLSMHEFWSGLRALTGGAAHLNKRPVLVTGQ